MTAIGRPARIVSICFPNGPRLDEICAVVEREARRGADLIALPETFLNQNDTSAEALDGPSVTALGALARRYSTNIICPIDRLSDGRRLNTAVLLDRNGAVAGLYNKVYPYWSEFDHDLPVDPGADVPVFTTDFGRVGIATCFDVNFPEVWQCLADHGAELVIWPSAYSAGTTLQAHALNHHYPIVTATQTGDCLVYDITGRLLLDERSPGFHVSRITLDLDRAIFHENFNLDKRDQLLRDHGDDIEQEQHLPREQWFVLRAQRPGISARALAHEYGMVELRDYIASSRTGIDRRRGWEFAERMRGAVNTPT